MERESRNALKVGILVLVWLVLLVVAVFSMTDKRLGQRGYEITVRFPSAQGLTHGAIVQYAGVAVGEVKDVRLVQRLESSVPEVEITVWLPHNIKLHEDVVANINTFGLLGEKYLEFTPMHGEGQEIGPGYELKGIQTASMENILQQSNHALMQFNKILDHLTKGQGTIGKLIYTDELHRAALDVMDEIKRNPWKLLRRPRGAE